MEHQSINAYVFLRDSGEEDLERIDDLVKREAETGVHFVKRLSGPFDAIVGVSVESLQAVERAARLIRGQGSPLHETAITLPIPWPDPLPVPNWGSPAVEAFVRIRVAPGRVTDVLEGLRRVPDPKAAVPVAGDFDILFQVGGDTFDQVAQILVEHLHRVDGIVSTTSCFYEGERYAP